MREAVRDAFRQVLRWMFEDVPAPRIIVWSLVGAGWLWILGAALSTGLFVTVAILEKIAR